uniref:Uncharacterized protein n=1 Tax=Candida gigantensis TaxID=271359 RepID=S5TP57_9ASCO|nr:hypothetical protein [Candida gigantensis]YP_008475262.1 hypothetical protein [Candida gigantensis]AGS44580.1 hypothetical protein [Candida gigantensis]AGS44581.1 hypothetical protein [Candida gigantensis]
MLTYRADSTNQPKINLKITTNLTTINWTEPNSRVYSLGQRRPAGAEFWPTRPKEIPLIYASWPQCSGLRHSAIPLALVENEGFLTRKARSDWTQARKVSLRPLPTGSRAKVLPSLSLQRRDAARAGLMRD